MAVGRLRLVDKSAWEQARYDERARQRLHELRAARQLGVCIVSMAELLYSARNAEELTRVHLDLSTLVQLPMTSAAEAHIVSLMAVLANHGHHRLPIPDLMLAGIAHAHGAVILHYDSDYERIALANGQAQEWIIPRGTGHARSAPGAR